MKHSLNYSKQKLVQVVNARLKKLKKTSSLDDLQNANEFIQVTRSMAEHLQFISNLGEKMTEHDGSKEQDEDDIGLTDIVDFVAEGCFLLTALNSVKDIKKIEEGNLQWISDETNKYLEEARIIFGCRIPVPPNIVDKKYID